MDPLAVAGLASTRTYPLRSSFRPTYNMAVNLVAQVGRERRPRDPRDVLRPVPGRPCRGGAGAGRSGATRRGWRATPRRWSATSATSREYAALRHEIARLEKDGAKERSASRRAEAAVSPGGAAHRRRHQDAGRPTGRLRRRRAAQQVAPRRDARADGGHRGPAAAAADPRRRADAGRAGHPRQGPAALQRQEPQVPARPRHLAAHRGALRPAAAAARRRGDGHADEDAQVAELRRQLRAHPCHQCPDREDHARWAERWWRLKRETVGLQRKVDGPDQLGGPDVRPDLRAARRDGLPRAGRRRGDAARASTCGGSTPRRTCSPPSACGSGCGSGSTRPGWPPSSPPSSTSRGATRPTRPRGCPPRTSPRRGARCAGCGRSSRTASATSACPLTGDPDGGMAWMMHRWAAGGRLDDGAARPGHGGG